MDFATRTITAGGGPRTDEYTTAVLQDEKKLRYFRSRIAQSERHEQPLTRERLREIEEQGNQRKPLRPNHGPIYQVNIARSQKRWEAFARFRGEGEDWRELVKGISWRRKGLIDSFLHWALDHSRSRITTYSALQRYLLQTWTIYHKYTAEDIDERVMNHGTRLAQRLAVLYGLRREPAIKNNLGPGTFIYLVYFRMVIDRSTFNIGLNRLSDTLIRMFQMFAGVRTHELVYEPNRDNSNLKANYYDKCDAFADLETADKHARIRLKECWICGETDERTMGDGKDRFAMQVFFRFHKGENKEIRPTIFLFVEENLPLICPISSIIAKALAEGVIESGFDCAEKFFSTKLALPAVQIYWKREFWHPLKRSAYDYRTDKLGEAVGLPGKLHSYNYRRGQLQSLDTHFQQSIRNQAARHKPNSTIYERYYHNVRMNAVPQDAFMERGTTSPYLAVLNHLGVICDENAPTNVPDELMQAIGPDITTRRLEEEMSSLQARLEAMYGEACRAIGDNKAEYTELRRKLATARKNHRGKIHTIIRADYFKFRNDRELERQLKGNCEPQGPQPKPVVFSVPERRRLAEILGDLDEDLPRDMVIRRKIDAINAWVDYAWKVELKESTPLPMVQKQGVPAPPDHVDTRPTSDTTALQNALPPPRPPMPLTPPPPYAEAIADSSGSSVSVSKASSTRQKPDPCIFCGKKLSRIARMWDHVDSQHLAYYDGRPMPCPFLECKGKSLFNDRYSFKSHIYYDHHVALRPEEPGPGALVLGWVCESPGPPKTLKRNRWHNDEVRESPGTPRTPRIILKRKQSEEGPESPRKRRIVLKCS
ncbi:hypothetical protein MKZ38_009400 [Zalerion maritima]|uniref:Uncharacterized protein n=1 Tax=Zalerion maritima TaxID=339359 RepID=A0AAD5WVR0_9PEZI|nr:hypothetical protein MKZ38_009400 [Zalerion maritima]